MRELYDPKRQRVPVRVWARAPSEEATRQLVRIATEPWATEFVAGMADMHVAEGVAVGTVFATERTIVPRALGGDLGCGMAAIRLSLESHELGCETLVRLLDRLERAIPTAGQTHRHRGVTVPDALLAAKLSTSALTHARDALAPRHLGTLGGGNHFLELDRAPDGGMWLLVHSGSRGLGAAIATHHLRAAEAHSVGPFAGLDVEEAAGVAYLDDLSFALAFAEENRRALAARALSILGETLRRDIAAEVVVDLHHNFITRELWGGRDLLVHRKGAVRAERGALALIPGSMGTASYLVKGLGNAASFGSCSHGAGRVLRRSEARARISAAALTRGMRHVVFSASLASSLVEEAPAAYRDIREVLEDQDDLVTRQLRLEPIAVLKG